VSWNELELVRWLGPRLARARLTSGPFNDAVVLGPLAGRRAPAVCLDATLEGVHFLGGAAPGRVGWKACARSLSDLAASGARPRAVLVSLQCPLRTSARWLRAAMQGVERCARAYGAFLVGGDTSASRGERALVVCAVGDYPGRARPVGRDGARPGDWLCLTGPVGGSARGRHLDLRPRVQAGLALGSVGVRAMLDVSDGLAIDAWRLAVSSGVRVELWRVPVHRDARALARFSGRSPREHALGDGEDHELLAAVPARALARALHAAPGLKVVGRVRRGRGLWIAERDLDPRQGSAKDVRWRPCEPGEGGWVHGARG
jgi:thiamine-monophosphate kinase